MGGVDGDDSDEMLPSKPEEKTVTLGKEKVAIKNRDDDDSTFNPRSKNQDKMFGTTSLLLEFPSDLRLEL
jgi:hypothetical protein